MGAVHLSILDIPNEGTDEKVLPKVGHRFHAAPANRSSWHVTPAAHPTSAGALMPEDANTEY